MNFKLTLWKSIVSFLSGIFMNYILVGNAKTLCNCVFGVPCNCLQPTWLEFAFDPVPVVASLIVIVIVYSIWSFIQKK